MTTFVPYILLITTLFVGPNGAPAVTSDKFFTESEAVCQRVGDQIKAARSDVVNDIIGSVRIKVWADCIPVAKQIREIP